GRQRARAEPLHPVPVDVQAEIPQLRQQLIVAQEAGRGPQRPAVAHELATDALLVDPLLADPVESDIRHLHAFLRSVGANLSPARLQGTSSNRYPVSHGSEETTFRAGPGTPPGQQRQPAAPGREAGPCA